MLQVNSAAFSSRAWSKKASMQ